MSESDEFCSTSEEIKAKTNLLPDKSKSLYEKTYNHFMEWKTRNGVSLFSENVFIAYFEELAKYRKPSSLWSCYSMIKSTINIKHQIDISKYSKLTPLLKRKSEGYSGKKAKVFSSDQIKMFLDLAPDEIYLLTKVSMIFGIFGACGRQELHNVQFADVNDLGSHIFVTLQNTITKKPRTFTITGKYLAVVQNYIKLRKKNVQNKYFFLNYQKGKCTSQNVGINKMGAMGKMVAAFLNLPNPELYTGHCFRRSSATLLVDAGGEILALKRHGGWRWKSTTVAERSSADSQAGEPEELMDTEQHAVYIKEEPLSYEMDEDRENINEPPHETRAEDQNPFESIYLDSNYHQDEERDNSNESPHESPAEDQKPFGHIYLDSNPLQVDGTEANTELSSNFPIKPLNWNESGTINPEFFSNKELVETAAKNQEASETGKWSKAWKCSFVMCRAIFDSKWKMDEHLKKKHLTNDSNQVKKRREQLIAPKFLAAPLNNPQANPETSKKKFLLLVPETPQSGGVRPQSLGKVLLKTPQLDTPESSSQPPKLPEFPKIVSTFQLPSGHGQNTSQSQSSPHPPVLTSSEESTRNQLTLPDAPSDLFTISLAQFSADTRIALKQKIIEFVEVVAKHKLDPKKFIFAYSNKT